MSQSEQLREALIDLERARAKEHALRIESESLLAGLHVLSLSDNREDMFRQFLEVIRAPLDFEEAFILSTCKDGYFCPSVWTSDIVSGTVWLPEKTFKRVLRGKPLAVFDVSKVPEWQSQPQALLDTARSALLLPLASEKQEAILICTHSTQGHFGRQQVNLAKRLILLVSQALVQFELRETIQEREERLRTIINHAPVILWSFDQQGDIVHVEGNGLALLGTHPQEWWTQHPSELHTYIPSLARDVQSTLRGKATASTFSHNGHTFESHYVPLFRKEGPLPDGVIGFATDVTDRVKMETILHHNKALQKARDAAVQANHAKTFFLANMSHELRTPLNAIIGYTELLIEHAEESDMMSDCQDLRKIHQAGQHLQRMISNLLDLSKIEAEKLAIHMEQVHIPTLIQDILAILQPLASRNKNELHTNIELTREQLFTDDTRLRQILINLLSNACKFTHTGQIKLSVHTADDKVIFSVSDNGIGITPQQLTRIFDPYTQAEDSTVRKYGGTGLGLTISKQLSQLLGGNLTVESELHVGTTFTLWLPLSAPEQTTKPST